MDTDAEPLSPPCLKSEEQDEEDTNKPNIMNKNKNEVSFEEKISLLETDGSNVKPTLFNENNSCTNSNLPSLPHSSLNFKSHNSSTVDYNCDANKSNFLTNNSMPSSSSSSSDDHSANFRQFQSFSQASTKKSAKKTEVYQRPPDGGWGWMVVFASFMINLISDGVSLSFGVIFVELVDYFGESKSKTAWVGSLFLSIPLITGPIASALTDHFGCRKVAVAGSLLSALGFFIGQFSTKIEHLFFAFSMSGFGLALCYVTSIVSVAYYFEKRRSLATGLAVCGTGFGTFLFAPFIIFLLEEYRWRGTLLILSAVFLNIVCFGLLIRDLNIDTSASRDVSEDSTSDLESNLIESETNSLNSYYNNEQADLQTNHCGHAHVNNDSIFDAPNQTKLFRETLNPRIRHISECEPSVDVIPRTSASLINIPTYIKNNTNSSDNNNITDDSTKIQSPDDNFGELTFRRGGYLHNLICFYPHLLSLFLPWDLECNDLTVKTVANCGVGINCSGDGQAKSSAFTNAQDTTKNNIQDKKSVEFGSTHIKTESNQSIKNILPNTPEENGDTTVVNNNVRKFGQLLSLRQVRANHHHHHHAHHLHHNNDLLAHRGNCLHNLRLQRGSLTYRSAMLIISKYRLKASSAPDIYRTSMATINEDKGLSFFANLKEILYDMVDFSNFKSIRYSIFCVSNFFLYACIDVPYVCLPDQAITSGASDKEGASLLISIVGVFNTLGVVFVGYIGDKPWLDASFIYAIFITISGVALAAIPLTTNYMVIASLAAVYGFTISANYSLVSVILVELISLDSFTNAYGMLLLVQGFGSLIGPPMAGWLYDTSGTYDEAFYITGLCVLVSGIFVIPVGKKKNCFLWSPRTTDDSQSPALSSTSSSSSLYCNKCYCCRDNSKDNRNDLNQAIGEDKQKPH